MFGYKNGLIFPIHVSDKKFDNSIALLHVTYGDKSHYVYIKDFNRFMFYKKKKKITIKNTSVRVVYGVLVVKCVDKTQRKLFEH